MTTAPLIFAAIKAIADGDPTNELAGEVGELLARMVSLRQLSVSVARTLAAGESAALQAALVKDLGTRFEQQSVGLVAELLDNRPSRAMN